MVNVQHNMIDNILFIIINYALKEHTYYNHNGLILQKKDDFFKPSKLFLIKNQENSEFYFFITEVLQDMEYR